MREEIEQVLEAMETRFKGNFELSTYASRIRAILAAHEVVPPTNEAPIPAE